MKLYLQKNKISFEYIEAFLLIVFCNLWVYKARPVLPFYYFYFIALFAVPALLLKNKIIKLSKSQIFSIFLSLYIFSTLITTSTEWQYTVHFAVSVSYFVLTLLYIRYLNRESVLNIVSRLFGFNFIYMSAEAYWRLSHPMLRADAIISEQAVSAFYMLKSNSFMVSDSNGVALIAMTFAFFAYYLYRYVVKDRIYMFYTFWFSLLVALSFSRSAWIATFFGFVTFWIIDFLKKNLSFLLNKSKLTLNLLIFLLIVPVTIVAILIGIFTLLMKDGSFISKIELFKSIGTFFKVTSLKQMFLGIGSSLQASNNLYGKFPHSMILTLLTWLGVLGSILVYSFWGMIIKSTKGKGWLIVYPHILAGFSFFYLALPLFYVTLAIMYYFENLVPKRGLTNENTDN